METLNEEVKRIRLKIKQNIFSENGTILFTLSRDKEEISLFIYCRSSGIVHGTKNKKI